MDNKDLMIKVVKTLRYAFDLTTDENGMVKRTDGSIISHEDNFLTVMKLRHIINGDAYQEDRAIDWTSAQLDLRVTKMTVREPVIETINTHGPNDEFKTVLTRGGRTGTKVHLASNGGSGSYCGHWFKAHISHFQICDDTPLNRAKYHRNLCTKCFSEKAIAKATALANS